MLTLYYRWCAYVQQTQRMGNKYVCTYFPPSCHPPLPLINFGGLIHLSFVYLTISLSSLIFSLFFTETEYPPHKSEKNAFFPSHCFWVLVVHSHTDLQWRPIIITTQNSGLNSTALCLENTPAQTPFMHKANSSNSLTQRFKEYSLEPIKNSFHWQ